MNIFTQENFKTAPSLILFDLDNTLYEYNTPHKLALKEVSSKISSMFSITEENFKEVFNEARKDVKNRLLSTGSSHSRLLYFQRCMEIMDLGSQPLAALDLEQTYWITFLRNAQLFDGVREFLDEIRLMGIPSAIITDLTSQIQFKKIINFRLDQYFDYVVTSEEAGCDKPAKAIYDLALNKTSYQSGSIWMIGDDPEKDIKGSKDAINAITLEKVSSLNSQTKDIKPDLDFHNFKDIKRLLLKINNYEK